MRDGTLQCKIVYNEYGGYCIPDFYLPHCNAARDITAGKVYEKVTIDFIKANCGQGDVVHAGAYVGDFLPGISDSLTSGAKLWAFEPNPLNHLCATVTKLINRLDNVVLFKAGVGQFFGITSMKTIDEKNNPLCGMGEINNDGNETIEMVTIDDIVPDDRNVTVLHLDVEHYERQALEGAFEIIHRCWPVIILETLPALKWLSENVLKLGYRTSGKVGRNTVFIKS